MRLIALYPILFESHQYQVGDILPAHSEAMVKAWLEAGTAKWAKDESQEMEEPPQQEADKTQDNLVKEESCTGATESEEEIKEYSPEEVKKGKEAIGRSAKTAANTKGNK
ncbi:hypothetical protein C8E03_110116 [Lachnotalea glycerini]|uniref:Uncharacterized protein n=1 Tax=Lachnotalea glycerini TaxID=1763509 RepID=A0A318EJ27_9FIRM|nr:hypothetical protein [Lachnotalea glycerini]OYO76213.1 hypothetical protein CG709_15640 [Lachnotalea glycerini]PXV87355.1 hypothetical protein C8E03_110116 [Lachnotalea glycerini]